MKMIYYNDDDIIFENVRERASAIVPSLESGAARNCPY